MEVKVRRKDFDCLPTFLINDIDNDELDKAVKYSFENQIKEMSYQEK